MMVMMMIMDMRVVFVRRNFTVFVGTLGTKNKIQICKINLKRYLIISKNIEINNNFIGNLENIFEDEK